MTSVLSLSRNCVPSAFGAMRSSHLLILLAVLYRLWQLFPALHPLFSAWQPHSSIPSPTAMARSPCSWSFVFCKYFFSSGAKGREETLPSS